MLYSWSMTTIVTACLKFCAGIIAFMKIVTLDKYVPYPMPISKKAENHGLSKWHALSSLGDFGQKFPEFLC